MIKLAAIAAVLALASAPVALAQSQGQLEVQQGQMPRTPADATHGTDRSYSGAEKGVGEQHGQPAGDRLARPADPSKPTQGDPTKPSTERGSTAATNAKPGEVLTDDSRTRPQSAERPPSAGQPTLDRSHNVDPGGRTPIKRADDGRNNPPPDPKK
ncbi:hypothetical protein [Azospirillum soli]|uniref:hypothetical protein n=1 Tax=Azospirillum soli TaxID=1304799 RepID=UPI001AEA616C|nr:hypothetical protein [Azospirillum soli]MBP2313421.1 hypothetical protein [Azospirillum soli]